MDIQVGGSYSFSVYPVAVLGTNFKNVLVQSILDADSAQALGLDILAQHALIYPSLPNTTVNNPQKYRYLKIKLPTGLSQIIAMEWINPDTLEAVNLGRFTIVIENESSSKQAKILEALAGNNFTVKSIQFDAAS
jgi:hypothetical protein